MGLLESFFFAFDMLIFYPLLCFLPYGWAFPITRWRGSLHFLLVRPVRYRILKDLEECFSERSEKERKDIARSVFQTQATSFYDTYVWTRYREKKWTKKFVTFEGLEHLEGSLKNGRGAILCGLHFGNYAYPAGYLKVLGYPQAGYIFSPWDLTKLNFFLKLHFAYGFWMTGWKSGARYVVAGHSKKNEIEDLLQDNYTFHILLDIPLPERKDLVQVKFLGQEAMFPSGAIHLQHKTDVPFHVMYMYRDSKDWRRQTIVISPELSFSGDVQEDLQLTVNKLETAVLQHPGLWWGWGYVPRMSPEYIAGAKKRQDFSSKVVLTDKRPQARP